MTISSDQSPAPVLSASFQCLRQTWQRFIQTYSRQAVSSKMMVKWCKMWKFLIFSDPSDLVYNNRICNHSSRFPIIPIVFQSFQYQIFAGCLHSGIVVGCAALRCALHYRACVSMIGSIMSATSNWQYHYEWGMESLVHRGCRPIIGGILIYETILDNVHPQKHVAWHLFGTQLPHWANTSPQPWYTNSKGTSESSSAAWSHTGRAACQHPHWKRMVPVSQFLNMDSKCSKMFQTYLGAVQKTRALVISFVSFVNIWHLVVADRPVPLFGARPFFSCSATSLRRANDQFQKLANKFGGHVTMLQETVLFTVPFFLHLQDSHNIQVTLSRIGLMFDDFWWFLGIHQATMEPSAKVMQRRETSQSVEAVMGHSHPLLGWGWSTRHYGWTMLRSSKFLVIRVQICILLRGSTTKTPGNDGSIITEPIFWNLTNGVPKLILLWDMAIFEFHFFCLDSVNKSNALSLKSPFLLLKFYICAHEIWLSYTFIYMVVVASSIYPKPKGFHFRPQMFICSAKAPGITRHEAHTPHEATQVVGRTELWVKPSWLGGFDTFSSNPQVMWSTSSMRKIAMFFNMWSTLIEKSDAWKYVVNIIGLPSWKILEAPFDLVGGLLWSMWCNHEESEFNNKRGIIGI